MLRGRRACVISVEKSCVVGVRTNYGNLLEVLCEREDTTLVLKEYH